MINRYAKGRRKEYKIKHKYESEGWLCFRSAGSHSPIDLVAIKDDIVLFIQCKSDNMIQSAKDKLVEDNKWLISRKDCYFLVV